ncbi:MAG: hypothetical protein AMXMBFR61_02210 [Fimbriimonadales bacterium]
MAVVEIQPSRMTPDKPRIRFDRNEFAGAFGDIGTDLPLIVGMILVAGLDAASVLILFGAMQVLTALWYRMPIPVQPLKAVAALVIAQKATPEVLYGAGLAIGIVMLALTVTGGLDLLARIIPKLVIRGIQFGLGLQLATLALKEFVPADGAAGFVLAGVAFVIAVALLGNRKYPAALFIIGLGVAYALAFKAPFDGALAGIGLSTPQVRVPTLEHIWLGFLLLALPQIPLSLGNSVLATKQLVADYFPDRPLSLRKIGFTYSVMNLINPFFSGIPTCHGSGGLAGHYAFGARTGGSVVIYGALYLVLGLFLSGAFASVIQVFPKPILGVILAFEGLALMVLVRDQAATDAPRYALPIAIMVGLMAVGLPYGYVIGMGVGTILAALATRYGIGGVFSK